MTLDGCRVLVTRPAGQSEKLVSALRACGAEPIELPLLAIVPLQAEKDQVLLQAARDIIQQFDQFTKIIFISTNAVMHGLPMLENYWPQWPVGIEWYGIGIATQAALQKEDIVVADISSPENAMTTESLLRLPAFADLHRQRILIVQGEAGRDVLARELQQRGTRVDRLVCYRRTVPVNLATQWSAINADSLQVLMISSGEGLQNLLQLPDSDACKQCTIVVPSERVAGIARNAGFRKIVTADNASDDAMLKALQQALQQIGC